MRTSFHGGILVMTLGLVGVGACSGGPPPCDATTCADGCCTGDICYVDATAADQHCGADAGACVDCAVNGQICVGGSCCSPSNGPCCDNSNCCQASGQSQPLICFGYTDYCGGTCGTCRGAGSPCFDDTDCCTGTSCTSVGAGLQCE